MAVLPENMNKLNVNDTRASLSTIEAYIRYMGERIEFFASGQAKERAELLEQIELLKAQLKSLENT